MHDKQIVKLHTLLTLFVLHFIDVLHCPRKYIDLPFQILCFFETVKVLNILYSGILVAVENGFILLFDFGDY